MKTNKKRPDNLYTSEQAEILKNKESAFWQHVKLCSPKLIEKKFNIKQGAVLFNCLNNLSFDKQLLFLSDLGRILHHSDLEKLGDVLIRKIFIIVYESHANPNSSNDLVQFILEDLFKKNAYLKLNRTHLYVLLQLATNFQKSPDIIPRRKFKIYYSKFKGFLASPWIDQFCDRFGFEYLVSMLPIKFIPEIGNVLDDTYCFLMQKKQNGCPLYGYVLLRKYEMRMQSSILALWNFFHLVNYLSSACVKNLSLLESMDLAKLPKWIIWNGMYAHKIPDRILEDLILGRDLKNNSLKEYSRYEVNRFLNAPLLFNYNEVTYWMLFTFSDARSLPIFMRKVISALHGKRSVNVTLTRTILHFFILKHNLVSNDDIIAPLIDYIVYSFNANPGFSLKRKTIKSLVRAMEQWHDELYLEKVKDISWKKGDEKDIHFIYEENTYFLTQLTSSIELFEEGRVQQHCVLNHAELCVKGFSYIWSLRLVKEKAKRNGEAETNKKVNNVKDQMKELNPEMGIGIKMDIETKTEAEKQEVLYTFEISGQNVLQVRGKKNASVAKKHEALIAYMYKLMKWRDHYRIFA